MIASIHRALPFAATVGFIGCGVGLLVDPKTALAAYLAAWFAVSAIPIGALGVLFTTYLVRGGWTQDLHEPLTGAALVIPAVGVLFLPVLGGMTEIYPWASGAGALPGFKAAYLAPWFFVLRTVVSFGIWTALAIWAARAYGNDAAMTRAASVGLILWSLTSSWAAVDWLESIEPQFHSSIYGLLALGFQLLAGFAFGLTVLLMLRSVRQMSNAAYAGTLLSVLMLWAYLHAMQYIIIWTGNIPEEVIWYLKRLEGGWGVALWALYTMQFILPFFVLLSAKMRESSIALLCLATGTLALRVLEAVVLILPPLDLSTSALLLDIPAAVLATGASFLLAWRTGLSLCRRSSYATAAG